MLAAAVLGLPGELLFAIAVLALLSDIFDGVIARRLGVATPSLRYKDSVADTVFYVGAGIALFLRYPDVLRAWAVPIGLLICLDFGRMVFERRKFGRIAAYHMWSAKFWGICLFLAFAEVTLTERAGMLFALAIVAGVWTDFEGFVASVLLPHWVPDVPTVYHAWRLARESQRGDEGA